MIVITVVAMQGYSELERMEEDETREKERQQALQRRRKRDEQFEKELLTFSTRTEPLGKDRNFNRYWYEQHIRVSSDTLSDTNYYFIIYSGISLMTHIDCMLS